MEAWLIGLLVVLAIVIVLILLLFQKIQNVQKYNEELMDALQNNNIRKAVEILSLVPADYPLDGSDRYGSKIIHQATILGNFHLLEKLLLLPVGNKINVNETIPENGNTPLHLASIQGKLAIVLLLLKHVACVDQRNREGWTALHLACMKGRIQVKQALLAAGADVTLKTRTGITAFELQETEKVRYSDEKWKTKSKNE